MPMVYPLAVGRNREMRHGTQPGAQRAQPHDAVRAGVAFRCGRQVAAAVADVHVHVMRPVCVLTVKILDGQSHYGQHA